MLSHNSFWILLNRDNSSEQWVKLDLKKITFRLCVWWCIVFIPLVDGMWLECWNLPFPKNETIFDKIHSSSETTVNGMNVGGIFLWRTSNISRASSCEKQFSTFLYDDAGTPDLWFGRFLDISQKDPLRHETWLRLHHSPLDPDFWPYTASPFFLILRPTFKALNMVIEGFWQPWYVREIQSRIYCY